MAERRLGSRSHSSPLGGPFAVVGLVGLALAALVLAIMARGGLWFDVPRGAADDALGPARSVTSAPLSAARSLTRGLSDHLNVYEENQRLREENARLRAWYDLAQSMRDKMTRYERLLVANPDPGAHVVVARVVAETDGPFVHARLLNAGRERGVEPGQAVLSERGLVGRVVAAGRRSARVLLLKDLNSRIPVMVERTDVRAVLGGDTRPRPRMEFLPRGHSLQNGDRIVTSGDAGLLPRGLPVGEAFVDARGVWRVRLYANDAPVDYVRVVRFDFPSAPEREPDLNTAELADADEVIP